MKNQREKPSIIFFGTPKISDIILQNLINEKNNILAVVTQPDKTTGRQSTISSPPVKETAQKNDLKILQPEKLADIKKILKNLKPDLFVVISYGKIISNYILEIPLYCSINIHFSLLPKYRGSSPIQTAILNCDTKT